MCSTPSSSPTNGRPTLACAGIAWRWTIRPCPRPPRLRTSGGSTQQSVDGRHRLQAGGARLGLWRLQHVVQSIVRRRLRAHPGGDRRQQHGAAAERGRNVEAGAKWDLKSNLFATAAVSTPKDQREDDRRHDGCDHPGRQPAGDRSRVRTLGQSHRALGPFYRLVADEGPHRSVGDRGGGRRAAVVLPEQ